MVEIYQKCRHIVFNSLLNFPKNLFSRKFFLEIREVEYYIYYNSAFLIYCTYMQYIKNAEYDNIQLPLISQKPSPLGTVLNLKGSNSCLDLVGDQHHDIFCNQLQVIRISEVIKQFTYDQLQLVARVSECQKNSIVCQTVSNTPVSVMLMSVIDLLMTLTQLFTGVILCKLITTDVITVH